MTQTNGKSRQQAEAAFKSVQPQFFSRNSAFEELDSIVVARDQKTLQLREARIAKELQDRIILAASLAISLVFWPGMPTMMRSL